MHIFDDIRLKIAFSTQENSKLQHKEIALLYPLRSLNEEATSPINKFSTSQNDKGLEQYWEWSL